MHATGMGQEEPSNLGSAVSQSPPSLLGQTIDGRYRVEALLGEGGMGLVYRVMHTRLNKPLAIKILRRENTRDEEVLARFRSEAQSASAIGNEHIVDINDFGVLGDGSTYFVMECLEGVDLIEAMDRTPRMAERRAVHIAAQICRAIGAAHEAGIVHRDLKPENVFLIRREDQDDFVKVLDFGIAKVANRPTRLTRQGEVLGTPHYMSPEQCEGENVDHRTDIYALGVLLYEMLTGHVPHDADTMMGILTKHLYEDPMPPRVRVPQVSEALERVIMRCLAKKPDARYQTMRELEADLCRIQSGEEPKGREAPTLAPTRPPAARRPSVSPVYLAGLAIAVLALVGTLAIGSRESETDDAPPVGVARPQVEATDSAMPATGPASTRAATDASQLEAASAPTVDSPPQTLNRTHAHRRRTRPKARVKTLPEHDPAILDPWQ